MFCKSSVCGPLDGVSTARNGGLVAIVLVATSEIVEQWIELIKWMKQEMLTALPFDTIPFWKSNRRGEVLQAGAGRATVT